MSPLLSRLPRGGNDGTTALASGSASTQPTQNTASVHYHLPGSQPPPAWRLEQDDERKDGEGEPSMRQLMALLMEQSKQAKQQQQQLQALAELVQQDRRQQQLHGAWQAGEYSAAASIPLPPRAPASHRASIGRPSTPVAYEPFSPAAPRAAVSRPSPLHEAGGEADPAPAAADAALVNELQLMPERDPRMEHVRKTMSHTVKTFHGQTANDTYTVIDWVEKVDTEFSIHMGARQSGRLDVVRSLLAGTALLWVNRRMQECIDAGQAVEWQQLRGEFIDAHLGASTVETFKAELRALVLGSDGCKNPSELNAQFDRLAELAFPPTSTLERRLDTGRASTLGEEYGLVVARSRFNLFKRISENAAPRTLEEWKAALSRYWSAELKVKNVKQQVQPREPGGQYEGKGGHWRKGQQATVSAVLESDPGMTGEPHTDEGADDAPQQLSRAAGQGGERQGRPQFSSDEKRKLYEEGRCFTCGKTGHIAAKCSKAPQQGKGKAG